MCTPPEISATAALLADPTRAAILVALIGTARRGTSELAEIAGITQQTASAHLSKLVSAGFLEVEREGRTRLYRLAGDEVASALEALSRLSTIGKTVDADLTEDRKAIRFARVCYHHIGGKLGVLLNAKILSKGLLIPSGPKHFSITPRGNTWFSNLGIDMASIGEGHRGIARPCLDWSERENHLGGPLGDSFYSTARSNGWLSRNEGSRALTITDEGYGLFSKEFKLSRRYLNNVLNE